MFALILVLLLRSVCASEASEDDLLDGKQSWTVEEVHSLAIAKALAVMTRWDIAAWDTRDSAVHIDDTNQLRRLLAPLYDVRQEAARRWADYTPPFADMRRIDRSLMFVATADYALLRDDFECLRAKSDEDIDRWLID
jgi:hypothetical protein